MTLKTVYICDVCGEETRETMFYKRTWLRVTPTDDRLSSKNGYSFLQGKEWIDICSAFCLDSIQKDMEEEQFRTMEETW